MHYRLLRLILLFGIAGLSACATHDEPYCGGSYKTEAQMERALGMKPSVDSNAQTVRY